MISSFLKHLLYNGYMPSTSPTNKPPASTVRIQFHMRKKRLQLHYNFTKLITRCHSLFLLWSEQTHQHGPTIHAWLHSEPFLAAWTVCSLQSTVDSNEIEGFTKMMGMRSQHAVFGEKVGFQPLELTGKRICIYLSIYLSIYLRGMVLHEVWANRTSYQMLQHQRLHVLEDLVRIILENIPLGIPTHGWG